MTASDLHERTQQKPPMSDQPDENRISLEDNSDKAQGEEEMAEAQGTTESATQDMKGGAQPESGGQLSRSCSPDTI